jgi:hypothetical protein
MCRNTLLHEILSEGAFGYADEAISGKEINAIFSAGNLITTLKRNCAARFER